MPENTEYSLRPDFPSAAAERIATAIAAEGPLTVARFMEIAASHYYASKDAFGAAGDFITAPEISQMFGEMIGAWIVDTWMQMGKPETAQLIELGPGRGTLAADIMRTISAWPDCRAAFTLHLVETSPLLRQKQADILMKYSPTWYERLEEVPLGTGFIVANEFLDALPIRQFERRDGQWLERHVSYDAGAHKFLFTLLPPKAPPAIPSAFSEAAEGSIFETSPATLDVMRQIATRVAEAEGAALLVDYGHVKQGIGDTLQTLRHHKYSPVLEAPGQDDITAHVDFAACAEAAAPLARVVGPITQGEFLISLGIEARAAALSEKANENQQKEIGAALHRLTGPEAMGRLFKVMALLPLQSEVRPAGFGEGESHEVSDDRA